jgi:hypothetical protein
VIVSVVVMNQLSTRHQPANEETATKKGSPSSSLNQAASPKEDRAPEKTDLKDEHPDDRHVVKTLHPQGTTSGVSKNAKSLNPGAVAVQRSGVKEYALNSAQVTTLDAVPGLVEVPVDASVFRLSIDNGRGVARTISLPPVSFGSQRLLPRDAAFVPASSRGDW